MAGLLPEYYVTKLFSRPQRRDRKPCWLLIGRLRLAGAKSRPSRTTGNLAATQPTHQWESQGHKAPCSIREMIV
jgi:hypothetical protein